jgi:hypothetical protein
MTNLGQSTTRRCRETGWPALPGFPGVRRMQTGSMRRAAFCAVESCEWQAQRPRASKPKRQTKPPFRLCNPKSAISDTTGSHSQPLACAPSPAGRMAQPRRQTNPNPQARISYKRLLSIDLYQSDQQANRPAVSLNVRDHAPRSAGRRRIPGRNRAPGIGSFRLGKRNDNRCIPRTRSRGCVA